MTSSELRQHITQTYLNLRVGTAITGILFPVVLWLVGRLIAGMPLQGSMSAYYYTPMREVFVGLIFAIGSFMYLYKGFSRAENYALNCAGVLALGVALFPTSPDSSEVVASDLLSGTSLAPYTSFIHGFCAVVFFLAIAYVCIFRNRDSLGFIEDEACVRKFERIYLIIGSLMVILPATAAALAYFSEQLLPDKDSVLIFFVELAGVWVFSAYWLVKTWELNHHTERIELKLIREP